MPAITPEFLFDFESNMQAIQEDEYARLGANLWWSKYMRVRSSGSRREIVAWLLSTAQIKDLGEKGGNMSFEDLVSAYTEFENRYAGVGLKLLRAQIEDNDGNGLELAGKWSGDVGAYMAYWPQKTLVKLIKDGHLAASLGYDKQPFFVGWDAVKHTGKHPYNPYKLGLGGFANLFTGAADAALYPGACPIDDSVTLDVAIVNLAKVIAYIRSIKMPNGEDPRFLRPVGLVVPPRMQMRAVQLTNAKFIAQAATGGAATADVEAVIQSMGFVQPTIADELAGFESDTTYFVACEEISSTSLGGFVYIDREGFAVRYFSGQDGGGLSVELDRAEELEWHCKGRNTSGYGHPYAFFKGKGS